MQNTIGFDNAYIFRFQAIGGQWEIETVRSLQVSVQRQILETIELFDKTYSGFRKNSLIYEMLSASSGGVYEFPDNAVALFNFYTQLHISTKGAVDPVLSRKHEMPGYHLSYSCLPGADLVSVKDASWGKDIAYHCNKIETKRPLSIDIGAAGKGLLIDMVCDILFSEGVDEFIVDASGDIRHAGIWDLPVGLQHPSEADHVVGVVDLKNGALCASARNKRNWVNWAHDTINAGSRIALQSVIATWVIADNAMTADGLATALFFTDVNDLMQDFKFSSVRMFSDGTIEKTENFEGELYL